MNQRLDRLQNSSFAAFYRSFSPAGRAVIWFLLPFTLLDAAHYYSAGAALIFSFPLLLSASLLCGALPAYLSHQQGLPVKQVLQSAWRAGFQLWLASTIANTFLILVLGVASLGAILLSSAIYLCLAAPLQVFGSSLAGWLGGWLCVQFLSRSNTH